MSDLSNMYYGVDHAAMHLGDIKRQLVDFAERNDRFFELFKLLITSQEKTAKHLESLVSALEKLLPQAPEE